MATSAPAPATSVGLPVKLWGLDPAYWSCLKLFAEQVHALTHCDDTLPDGVVAYQLHGHPVHKVEVMGVIVGVLVRNLFVAYSVDDGTGILHCTCWYNQNAAFATPTPAAAAATAVAGGLPPPLPASSILHSATALRRFTPASSIGFVSTPVQLLNMGNVVRVRGRITQRVGNPRREISVESLHVETDPNAELLHWLEAMDLMQNVYSKPSQILLESRASHVAQSAQLAAACIAWLTETSKQAAFTPQLLLGVPSLLQLAQTQAHAITTHRQALSARSASTTSSSTDSAQECTANECVQAAIDYLLQLGSVLLVQAGDARYEVTSLRRHVVPLVFRLIADGASSTVGLHRDAIVSLVQSRHANLSAPIVQEALDYLAAQSDICEWSTAHTYVCTNPAAAEGLDALM